MNKKEALLVEALNLLDIARSSHLVARPYRNETRTDADGICFCCDDCCDYFLNPEEVCDKGDQIAVTDYTLCNGCGDCVEVCYFKARTMEKVGIIYLAHNSKHPSLTNNQQTRQVYSKEFNSHHPFVQSL